MATRAAPNDRQPVVLVAVTLPVDIRRGMNAEVGAERAPLYLSRDGRSDTPVETS